MGMAPNRKSVVQAVSDADPARFRRAHTGQPGEDDWIKAVAAALHAEDPRWGLNGKRGDPNVLSLDVVTFRVGPTDRHVEAFDICGACGGGNPSVVWNDITNYATMGQPGTAIWVKPEGVPVPVPTPAPVPVPQPPSNQPVLEAIAALGVSLAEIHNRLTVLETVAGDIGAKATSAAHDAKELNAARHAGWPAVGGPAGPWPVYVGSTKPFGGAVRLTPEVK
jgi:hypothetical protein